MHPRRLLATVAIAAALLSTIRASAAGPAAQFACSGLVEYVAGDLPLIITAPHGGRLRPADIPDRAQGVLLSDTSTDALARDLAEAVRRRTGRAPHLVICHLHRAKVDCNRAIGEGAQSNAAAATVWQAFHAFVDEAAAAATRSNAPALLVDLHGHSHPAPRVELGYLLTRSQLAEPADRLEALAAKSSIRDLAARRGTPFANLLRGTNSLGGLLQARSCAATPSPGNPDSAGQAYFDGGYITRRHGSRDGGTLSAVQVECPRKGFRSPEADRRAFADALAGALVEYLGLKPAGP